MPGDLAFRYVILGSGRQGTAAAYDLARFGGAARIVAPGAHRMERAVAAANVMEEPARRGIPHTARWESPAPAAGVAVLASH
jgi:NADPH-dependent 2,4-dienoyl-CoA reductase/sulfur reductase-like enzyme